SIAFQGNAGLPEDRIRRQMLTREHRWISFRGGLLREPVLKDDIDANRGLYLANGYLSVRVDPPGIKLTPDGRGADVTITIVEGPQSRIEAVSIEGEAEGVRTEDLMKAAGLTSSEIVTTQTVEQAADRLREELDKNGYAKARVGYRLEGVPERTRVIFSIIPIQRARVRAISEHAHQRQRRALRDPGEGGGMADPLVGAGDAAQSLPARRLPIGAGRDHPDRRSARLRRRPDQAAGRGTAAHGVGSRVRHRGQGA